MCVKCVKKCCPEEKLSVITQYAGRPLLAICSEMQYRQTCKRDENGEGRAVAGGVGEMVFRYGFVFDSLFRLDFLLAKCTASALPA